MRRGGRRIRRKAWVRAEGWPEVRAERSWARRVPRPVKLGLRRWGRFQTGEGLWKNAAAWAVISAPIV
jgi:hypothetical protein